MVDTITGTFSLTEGGRLHDLLLRLGMPVGSRGRLFRLVSVLAIGWLPVVVLTLWSGTALGSSGFLSDIGGWVRFVVVVPIVIMAEPLADRVLGGVVKLLRQVAVPEAERAAFDERVARVQRTATSDTVEILILLFALLFPHVLAQGLPRLAIDQNWYGAITGGDLAMSAAGRWYTWVSLPVVEFLMLRWVWRSLAWWGFLWQVSRLPLIVTPAHPDRAGGLGFLSFAPIGFVPFFVAASALGASGVATQMRLTGLHLADVKGEIAVLVLISTIVLLVPQLFFAPRLSQARRQALIRYGLAGSAMTRRFDARWIESPAADPADLLESPQSSAMIDFGGTYGQIFAMRATGLSLQEGARIVVPLVVPFLPLLLIEYSVKEVLTRVLEMVR